MKKISLIILFCFISLNLFSLAFAQQVVPDNLIDKKEDNIPSLVFGFIKGIFQGFIKVIKSILGIIKDTWDYYIKPLINKITNDIKQRLERGVEEKKPEIKEELKKETKELKQDVPETTKFLWQKFRNLINK